MAEKPKYLTGSQEELIEALGKLLAGKLAKADVTKSQKIVAELAERLEATDKTQEQIADEAKALIDVLASFEPAVEEADEDEADEVEEEDEDDSDEDEDGDEEVNLADMTTKELHEVAKSFGVKNLKNKKKAEIISEILELQDDEDGEDEDEADEEVDYTEMDLAELKALCKERDITLSAKQAKKKKVIIALLEADDEDEEDDEEMDYTEMDAEELLAECKERGIKVLKKKAGNKKHMIGLLEADDEE